MAAAAFARVRRFDLAKNEMLQHKHQNEPLQVILVDKACAFAGKNSG
jgi:hypothetical protein